MDKGFAIFHGGEFDLTWLTAQALTEKNMKITHNIWNVIRSTWHGQIKTATL